MRLLLATRSPHKAAEVRRILAATGSAPPIELVTPDDLGLPRTEAEAHLEPHRTFEENAASKARHFADLARLPTAADDSGLEVDALGGRPGVRTRRFAPLERYPGLPRDDANNRHLVALLDGEPPERRGARYVCAVCLLLPRPAQAERSAQAARSARSPARPERWTRRDFRGEAGGRIIARGRGAGGFGYDPIFLDEASNRTYAELTAAEKDQRSHRGRAFRALARFLAGYPG